MFANAGVDCWTNCSRTCMCSLMSRLFDVTGVIWQSRPTLNSHLYTTSDSQIVPSFFMLISIMFVSLFYKYLLTKPPFVLTANATWEGGTAHKMSARRPAQSSVISTSVRLTGKNMSSRERTAPTHSSR